MILNFRLTRSDIFHNKHSCFSYLHIFCLLGEDTWPLLTVINTHGSLNKANPCWFVFSLQILLALVVWSGVIDIKWFFPVFF